MIHVGGVPSYVSLSECHSGMHQYVIAIFSIHLNLSTVSSFIPMVSGAHKQIIRECALFLN